MKKVNANAVAVKVKMTDGYKTLVKHDCKDGIPLTFWYWIKLPCGGWREFDIRALKPELDRDKAYWNLACSPLALAYVSELLEQYSWDSFKKAMTSNADVDIEKFSDLPF